MKVVRKIAIVAAITVLLILGLEFGLRIFTEAPRGIFLRMVIHDDHLYPPNSRITRAWGPIPYLIRSNNLGFRGSGAIDRVKSADTLRIAAVGDSVTDGFFVDNEDSYPVLLEQALRERIQAEVINGAKGGGTIHRQYAIYRKYVRSLEPDIVVLMFVSNDLNEFEGLRGEELLDYTVQTESNNAGNWLSSRTALGETVLDLYLKLRFERYSSSSAELIGDSSRYVIPRNDEYRENALRQVGLSEKFRNRVLFEPESRESQALLANYLFVLSRFNEELVRDDSRLLFVYFPSYSQVYLDEVPLTIRDQLREFCRDRDIRFLDLTDAFRAVRYEEPLHLAPIDFHPNPAGNRVVAGAVAERLLQIAAEP